MVDSSAVRAIQLEKRACDICGANNPEIVFAGEARVKQNNYFWVFPYSIAVCKKCGFAFNSPAPVIDSLNDYYADGLTGYKKIGLPYSIFNRLNFLEKYSFHEGILVEVGGDQPNEFHAQLKNFFKEIYLVDVTNNSDAHYRTIYDLPSNYADCLIHYDVLEHITNPLDFLVMCHKCLKPNGVMVCEVPNLRLYPQNLLIQEFTHVNHFSVSTLTRLASLAGFDVIECNHTASRPYGFTVAFRKVEFALDSCKPSFSDKSEYLDALACLRGGIDQLKFCDEQINAVRQKIYQTISSGGKVVLWGVTDLMRNLLGEFSNLEGILVVDSDPRRLNHLKDMGVIVAEPLKSTQEISSANQLVICAPRYKDEIVNWIEKYVGQKNLTENIDVIGIGNMGQSLR